MLSIQPHHYKLVTVLTTFTLLYFTQYLLLYFTQYLSLSVFNISCMCLVLACSHFCLNTQTTSSIHFPIYPHLSPCLLSLLSQHPNNFFNTLKYASPLQIPHQISNPYQIPHHYKLVTVLTTFTLLYFTHNLLLYYTQYLSFSVFNISVVLCPHSNCCTYHLHCPYLMQPLQASLYTLPCSHSTHTPSLYYYRCLDMPKQLHQ